MKVLQHVYIYTEFVPSVKYFSLLVVETAQHFHTGEGSQSQSSPR